MGAGRAIVRIGMLFWANAQRMTVGKLEAW
jgi:hypothetical protein